MEAALALARTAYERHLWREAYDGFVALLESLAVDDVERLAVSAYLVGINPVSDDAWIRAHRMRLELRGRFRSRTLRLLVGLPSRQCLRPA